MARGCGCGNSMSCEKVRDCLQEWAPGAAYATTSVPTDIPEEDVRAPVVLKYTTSTGGSADVVDDGGGNLRIVRPGLWQATALIRCNVSTAAGATIYGNVYGADTSSWLAAAIPSTANGTPAYSVGVTVTGIITVDENSSKVIAPTGGRSYAALNAKINSATLILKRLAPLSSSAGQPPTDADAIGPAAEITRERAQLAGEA